MSRRGWTRTAAKPPMESGIRVKKVGNAWWSRHWIEALQNVHGGDSEGLTLGRACARAGRVQDLVIRDGEVRGRVAGSQPLPYRITIKLAQLSDAAWKVAVAGMAEKAQFAAALLAGKMPEGIDEVLSSAVSRIFPQKSEDLTTCCSCADEGDPCEHVAAAHYVLGEALDRDPFLLFELRGRTKPQIMEALREELAQIRTDSVETPGAEPEIPRVILGKLTPAEYDSPREKLPVLHFSFDEPVTHGAVLRQLGKPSGWTSDTSPAELLAPIVRAAAARARSLAMAEPETVETTEEVTTSPRVPSPRSERPSKPR